VQIVARWTTTGPTGPDVGDRVTSIVLPQLVGTVTVTCDAICTGRTTSFAGGTMRRSWQIAPRPFSSGALVR
jgi:hypothetical protein